jgi:hypothetical protein
LRELVELAQDGVAEALPRLCGVHAERPEVWRHLDALADRTERAWADALAATDPLVAGALRRKAAEIKQDTAGEQPTRLERLLVGRLVACWLEARFVEGVATNEGETSLGPAASRPKRLGPARRRHQDAVRELETLRQLLPGGRVQAGEIMPHKHRQRRS